MVNYNLDAPELDTGPWSPNLSNVRLHYARSPAGIAPSTIAAGAKWREFATDDKLVDVDELARWLKTVRPKSVHDLKPLLLLLQGTLEKLVDGDVQFWSGECADLRAENESLRKIIDEQNDEMEILRGMAAEEYKEKVSFRAVNRFKTAGFKFISQLSAQRASATVNENEAVGKLRKSREEAQERLDEAKRRLSEMEGQLSKMQAGYEKMEFDLIVANGRQREHEATILKMNLESAVMAKSMRELKRKMKLDGQQTSSTAFLGWSTRRPKAEWMCASKLLHGLSTVQFPAGSVVTLPDLDHFKGVRLALCDLPSRATIELPSGANALVDFVGTSGKVISFPEDAAKEPEAGCLIYVPGGTVITVPEEFNGAVHVPNGTILSAPVIGPSTSHIAAGKTIEVMDVDVPESQLIRREVPMGTTLTLPNGRRRSIRVPSECTFYLNTESNAVFAVPAGSTVRLADSASDQGSHLCLLPPNTVVHTEGCLPTKQAAAMKPVTVDCDDGGIRAPGMAMMLPGGCHITCKAGDMYVPSHTEYAHPEDPGTVRSAEAGIPFSADVRNGTKVQLPSTTNFEPPELALAMHEIGPRFAGFAMGVLPPDAVASSVVAAWEAGAIPNFDVTVGRMLVTAPPASTAEMLKLLDHSLRSRLLAKVSPGVAGAILFHMSETDCEQVLSYFTIGEDARMRQTREAIRAFSVANKIFPAPEDDVPPQKTTATERAAALAALEPFVAARVISMCSAALVASALSTLAEMTPPHCTAIIQALGEVATLTQQACVTHKDEDVECVDLLQHLAACDTEVEMHGAVTSLLKFYKDQYGFTVTLARMLKEDYRLMATDRLKTSASLNSLTEERAPSPRLTAEEGSLGSEFEFEDDAAPLSPEERAADMLQVVFSTEEITWGAGDDQSDVFGADGGSSKGAVFKVHVRASALLDAQITAATTGAHVSTETMLITPVVDADGQAAFTLSTLHGDLLRNAPEDALALPASHDSRASYWLKTTAAAMSAAVALIDAKRAAALAAGENLGETQEDQSDRDLLELRITAAAEHTNRMMADLMKRNAEVRGQLGEIRSYRKPPGKTCQIVVVLLLLLGDDGALEKQLGPELSDFPDEETRPTDFIKLWNYARSQVHVSQRHPGYILRRMMHMHKGMVLKVDKEAMKHMMAAKKILSSVSVEAVERSTSTLLNLFHWETSAVSQFDLQVELQRMVEEEEVAAKKNPSRKKLQAGASVRGGGGRLSFTLNKTADVSGS